MLDKIKALPEKLAFAIGISLILFSPIVLFLLSFGKWTATIQAIVWGIIATLFILSAADKRHSHKNRNSNYVK
ncbi:hypothetical protein BKP45_08660 [Anaerobacillus alkalidiazotrophicus]|uniref:Uncharacterized protein n=1 Tax=Anaerobacillus alkalidiazotrophicus TaxID=472963 RepID=A0A1S2M7T7_9BACI|nr:hypothetical protein [Anaerobacillus alkalidiazotrophicus]OIJ20704.1 hypothetical protein BKP45_08660 [Anaerobacillus alkalidiazotrophicus]